MPDKITAEKRSEIMSKVKSKDTKPEVAIKKFLRKKKLIPSKKRFKLPGKPDIVLPKYNAVLFINGCFWHQHSCSRGKRIPKSNRRYWKMKLEKNVLRDKKNQRRLRYMGWKVIKIWECQINKEVFLDKMLQNILR